MTGLIGSGSRGCVQGSRLPRKRAWPWLEKRGWSQRVETPDRTREIDGGRAPLAAWFEGRLLPPAGIQSTRRKPGDQIGSGGLTVGLRPRL